MLRFKFVDLFIVKNVVFCMYGRLTNSSFLFKPSRSFISVKTVFSNSGGIKTLRFDENSESDFSHESNTFSNDENVKIQLLKMIFLCLKEE